MTQNASTIPNIVARSDAAFGSYRQHTLQNITAADIARILGFEGNHDTDTEKCAYEWRFSVDGQDCAIWDYKGSHAFGQFSAWGPRSVFAALFQSHLAE